MQPTVYTVCRDLDTCTTRATCTSDHHHTRLSPSTERVGGIGEVLILPVPACRNLAARPVSKPCSGSYFSLSQRRRNTCNGARNPRDPAQKIPAPIGPLTGQLAFGIPVIGICGRLSKSASCIAGAGLGPLVTGVGLAAVKCLASAYLVPSAPFVNWNKLCVGKAHPYPKKGKPATFTRGTLVEDERQGPWRGPEWSSESAPPRAAQRTWERLFVAPWRAAAPRSRCGGGANEGPGFPGLPRWRLGRL